MLPADRQKLALAADPLEADTRKALEKWFVAESAFLEFFEEFEEEGVYPDRLGKCSVASPRQHPELHGAASEVADVLGITVPDIFVYESYSHVCDSEGMRRPRLEISARILRNYTDDELKHVVAKEMYHIYAGHLRLEVMAEKMLGLIAAVPSLPGIAMIRQFGGAAAFDLIGFNVRNTAFRWFERACFSAENFATAYVGNIGASVDATLLGVLNERSLVSALSLP
ncbi:MAG: hypothetical protein IPI43_27720 [Sandaracinaceae bacterium]|nr:hypothetical protein [Sandaracinaceae bacterium]